jgi:hypothetical protein
MRWHSYILIVISSLLLGCSTGSRTISTTHDTSAICVEDSVDQTFLGNSNELRTSDGFRQNIWLNFNKDGHGAICMDLDHQLYLVVDTDLPVRSVTHLNKRFSNLRISAATLRKRMDPDAFILNRDGIDWIFRIPPDTEESFAADLFNELLGLKLKPTDIRFQWD